MFQEIGLATIPSALRNVSSKITIINKNSPELIKILKTIQLVYI